MKTFIRDIIVYADKILITYNFTEHPPIKGKNSDSYEDIEMQAQSPAFSLNRGSFSLETFLPQVNKTNPRTSEFVLFFSRDYFGVSLKTKIASPEPPIPTAWQTQIRNNKGRFT